MDQEPVSCTVPFGNTTVTLVNSPSRDWTVSPSPSLSQSVFARYSPIPVEAVFERSDPVKPFSKTRGRSAALMPQPLSSTTSTAEAGDSSLYIERRYFGLSKYLTEFWMTWERMKPSHFSSVNTTVSLIRISSSMPASRK